MIFKDHIPKSEVYELRDSQHTLSLYCGRYIRITSEDVQMLLNKSEGSYIKDLSSSFIHRKILKTCRLDDVLKQWRNECFKSVSFCTAPETNAVDFETLYNELIYKTFHY